jgi:hypothetical protein
MVGSRKFSPEYISRDDIAALTHEATEISGIQYVKDLDKAKVEKLLNYESQPFDSPACASTLFGKLGVRLSSRRSPGAAERIKPE